MYSFEVHLTTHTSDLPAFTELCSSLGAKAVAIQLPHGQHTHQPMLSIIKHAPNLASILTTCHDLSATLATHHLPTLRTKIEIPANDSERYLATHSNGCYFEWHGKVHYQDLTALTTFAKHHHAHLSNNQLQGQNNLRFLTIRHHDKEIFNRLVNQITTALSDSPFLLKKSHHEYCVYDDKISLDTGWI